MDALETIERDGFTARLYADEDPQNPRTDWDQLGIIVHWHRRHTIGDRKITDTERDALSRPRGWALLERYLRATEGLIGPLIPVGLLDHSGLRVYAGGGSAPGDAQGWDSGTVGFIYTTKKKVDELGAPLDSLDDQLRGEIEEYNQYLSGDIYGYVIEDQDGNDAPDGSCWGFYGYDYAISQMNEALDHCIADEREESAKIDNMMHV